MTTSPVRKTGALAALALAASTLGLSLPATSAQAADDNISLQGAQDAVSTWVGKHDAKLKRADGDAFRKAGTYRGDNGTVAVAYERTHEGLPVIGGDFVVMTDKAGQVISSSVAQTQTVDVASTTATVDAARAADVSRGQLDTVEGAEPSRLVVVQDGATSKLAWETIVRGTDNGEASRQSVYVDARDAKVLSTTEHVIYGQGNAAYSGPNPLTLNTSLSGSTYSMTDPASTTRVCQDAANNQTFSGTDDVWGNGVATSRETGCVDAFKATQDMKGMLTTWLGRNGENGSGGWVPMRVGLNDINAYYDGTQVQIGHSQAGNWIGSLDVVAHEYGHGIDDKTPGGISGGGTQEFVGDVFGALTEAYSNQTGSYDVPDYTVGEEIDLVGQGPIRNMYNPSAVGDPNCYSSSIPSTEVHAAAGPGNHWFYLLAEGTNPSGKPASTTCNGSTGLTGIGIQTAGKIFYNAMLLKTSGANYLKYRTWTLQAAKNLTPTDCTNFNKVKAAWDAVSVPAQTADPTCGTTPPPTGGNLLLNPGFESGATSWTGTTGAITNNTGRPARTGTWKAWLGGNGSTSTETVSQNVTVPSTATAAALSYWIRTDTAESGSTAYDTMRVQVVVDGVTTTLKTFSNVGTNATYTNFSHSLLAYKGKTVTVKFLMNEDSSLQTSFVVDDTAVNVS
ncbi:M4 family metallopeptidase [Nocardioides sp. InS609-2]|uniref:M4 family metallopeptidase n=1 Tax=Nocardioides sp. InS609-2 TaxID=2760705 RepID=UPI0020C00CBB|nr:M4 family metallopeptidase [Nocardioides sp. InS609-2]